MSKKFDPESKTLEIPPSIIEKLNTVNIIEKTSNNDTRPSIKFTPANNPNATPLIIYADDSREKLESVIRKIVEISDGWDGIFYDPDSTYFMRIGIVKKEQDFYKQVLNNLYHQIKKFRKPKLFLNIQKHIEFLYIN